MNFDAIKKYLPWGAVGLPVVLSIVVLIFGLVNPHMLTKVLLIIAAVLLLALAAVLFVIFFVLGEKQKNFFLTDQRTGKNIPLEELRFGTVNDKMNVFLAERIESERDVTSGEILTRRGIFGNRDVFRPLVAYKILFDLSEQNSREGWNAYFSMSENAFSQLVRALNAANDNSMARRLMQLRQMRDEARLADFIVGNRRYLQGRMMIFVKSNIALFDELD